MCVCVYTKLFMYAYICIYIRVCWHISIYIYTIGMYIYDHVCTFVHIYIYVCLENYLYLFEGYLKERTVMLAIMEPLQ